MLPTASRLRRRTEFRAAVRQGARAARGALVVHLAAGAFDESAEDGRGCPRAGLVVGRTIGSAVTRNRVRRRLRHLVRERLHRLPDGARLVVRALPAAATATYDKLGDDLDAALDRLLGVH